MAAMSSARPSGQIPKPKKPIPPALQTSPNGVHSASSPSPSLASKRLPPGAQAPTSAGIGIVNGGMTPNGTGPRIMRRKDSQKFGDGIKPKIGRPPLDTPTINNARSMKKVSEPFVKTTSWLLKKYRKAQPSFILHLHPQYFRFDQQDGSFSYTSPMRILLEHIKNQTVPQEMLEDFHAAGIKFYECCLIVQIHDHRNTTSSTASNSNTNQNDRNQPFSIHNWNPYVTPSAHVPYPNSKPVEEPEKPETSEDKDKRPADTDPEIAQGPRIFTTVLFPTAMTLQDDMMRTAALRDATIRKQGQTSQPPLKKLKTHMSNQTLQSIEAETILATAPPLFLDPVDDIGKMKQLYTKLADPLCTRLPPAPKSRKRTVAELAADEALAAEQQKFMLVMDERLAPSSTTAATSKTTVADAEANSNATEARFERFKVLEDIKDSLREKKERETEARMLQQQQSIAAQQQQAQIRTKMEQERTMQEAAKAREMQAKNKELLRTQSNQSMPQQTTPQPQHQGSPVQMPVGSGQHGHPTPNNSVLANTQQLAASQTAHSSPAARHATPQNIPSPAMSNMIGRPQGAPMAVSSSNQGAGSPPRPPSAVPHGHSAIPMIPQRSQQPPSRNGTPAMVNGTPRLQQATPIMRNLTPTPGITQASPVSHASVTPMMGSGMLRAAHMNGQPQLTPQQQQQIFIQQQRQAQQQAQQQARQAAAMQNLRDRHAVHGMPTQMMTPQQQMALAAAQAQAQQQHKAQEIYTANMQAMQQQMQQYGNHPMANGMVNQVQQGNQPQMSSNDMIMRRNFTMIYKKLLTDYLNQLRGQYVNEASIPAHQLENAKQRAMQQTQVIMTEQRRKAVMQQQQQAAQHQQQQQQAAMFAQMQRNGQINGQINGGMGGMGNMGGM